MIPTFQSDPRHIRLVTESERLSFGHLYSPAFATEISLIDPLPHQRIAVYEHMLTQDPLRFLLADDAGAGKTIMSGLCIRELLARRIIRRVLVVPPAGLVANWQREMRSLFSLNFQVLTSGVTLTDNPFLTPESDLAIISVDTLAGDRTFARLQEPRVEPYDLVIFDEAHKLAVRRSGDTMLEKTERYRLAETMAGAPDLPDRWRLGWRARHLLLLTATPHMGHDFPYYGLWRLLDPALFSTFEAFEDCPQEVKQRYFIRRTKEEMVRYDGSRIYPERQSHTFSYALTQGPVSEQTLYEQVTDYLDRYYNQAPILNASAARLALSVFQRRLASSTYALLRSLQRRIERLETWIAQVQRGELDPRQLAQVRREAEQLWIDAHSSEEDDVSGGMEAGERDMRESEERILAESLEGLQAERVVVEGLLRLAEQVYEAGDGSKFAKLQEVLHDPEYANEKMIIFTEHYDTLDFLVRRLEAHGHTGRIVFIHGGMDMQQREDAVASFRHPIEDGGAQYLVATDAAGEGINLQVAWLMVNYDSC